MPINLQNDWSAGTVIAIGSGVTIVNGTLEGTGGVGSVTSIVAGTGLSGGTITSAGTISLVAAGTASLGGVIVGSGLGVSSGTISNAGIVSLSPGTGISVSGSTITNTGVLAINQGTLNSAGTITVSTGLTLAAGGTLTAGTPSISRTASFNVIGQPPAMQAFKTIFAQAGTLSTTGAVGELGTNPAGTWLWVVDTVHAGTVTNQGTITITSGGTISFPSITQAMSAGDVAQIVSQATPDTTGADLVLGFVYTSP